MIGRPSKFNPERERIVLETLRAGHGMRKAARRAGVAKSTVFAWKYASRAGRPGYGDFDMKTDRARDRDVRAQDE